jgi:hypothetical protein
LKNQSENNIIKAGRVKVVSLIGKKGYFLLVVLFILAGCQLHSIEDQHKVEQSGQQDKRSQPIRELTVEGSSFFSVGDWYDDETVLIIEDKEDSSHVSLYNIYTGKKTAFFQSLNPVISIKANKDYTYFLIQTTVSDQQAELFFLNRQGEIVDSFRMDSFDVQYVWNPYQRGQLFVTSFAKDWTFRSFLIDISKKSYTPYELPQPFAQWIHPTKFAYIPINKEDPLGDVPLYSHDLKTKQDKKLLDGIVSFLAFPKTILTIERNPQKQGRGNYTFYRSENLKKIRTFSMPLTSDVSGWLIPYYQFDSQHDIFYTFEAIDTAKIEEGRGFRLLAFSLKTGKKEVVLEGISNVPFKLSPNGKLSLMGYQLEQILNLKTKKIVNLINFT